MKKEEAIKVLKNPPRVYDEDMWTALDMAIDALSAQADGDLISRSALIKQIEIDSDGSPGWYGDTWQFMKTIAKMPSADAVQANSEHDEQMDKQSMTKEEAIRRLREYAQYSYGIWHDGKEDTRAFDMAIEALSAGPKTGEWITYYPFMLSIEEQRFNGAKNPTEPKPDKRFGRIKCSLCGCPHPIPNDKYCPGCGAEMLNGETWNRRASDEA